MPLLFSRRFWPLFLTQFFGAFNDNLFKNALVILIAYRSLSLFGLGASQLVAACAGLFILPFFLMSAPAGQLCDKYPKARAIVWIKLWEIAIMLFGAFGLLTDRLGLLILVLFFLGLQSTFFGPAKYSILPELLSDAELVKGNALVETGTFVAILLGTISGGVLIAIEGTGTLLVAGTGLLVALFGFAASVFIPKTPSAAPELRVAKNPITPLKEILGVVRERRAVFLSVLGISWFWFFGASFLTLFPSYAKDVLRGDEHVVTLLLSMFCVGIAIGSLWCGRLSKGKLELGLVPFGSIGMTLFVVDLFLAGDPYRGAARPALLGFTEFLRAEQSLRICFDLLMVSVFGGFFTVPLYTLVQQRSRADARSRVIAGTNILNSAFMVVSAVALLVLLGQKVAIPTIFLLLALLNLVVAVYIYTVIPEFLLRFVAYILASMIYRVRVSGAENIPDQGPVVLVCNHVTFVDWLIIASVCRRPPRFVMHHAYFTLPLLGFLFRDAKVIPIASAREDSARLEAALATIREELRQGEVVCLFPEGSLTPDGALQPFRRGIERIVREFSEGARGAGAETGAVPVVPMALFGLFGSRFSRKRGKHALGKLWAHVELRIGAPVRDETITASGLAERVAELGGWPTPRTEPDEEPMALLAPTSDAVRLP